MLKLKNDIDFKELKKMGFKEVQQNKRSNYIYMPDAYNNYGNSIRVNNDTNLYNLNYYQGEDRMIIFRFNEQATEEFNETMDKLYDLIQADMIDSKRGVNK